MILRLIPMLLLSTLLAACGGGDWAQGNLWPVELTGLGASPTSVAFDETGRPTTVQLFTRYSDGSEQDVSDEALWTSADPAVATVSGNGTVTPVGIGNTTITASHGEYALAIPVSVTVTFSGGDGTEATPFAITTAEQLNGLRFYTGDANANIWFELMGDIDLSDPAFIDDTSGWVPIGTSDELFAGTLDGQGFTISGLTIARPDDTDQGLFGQLSGTVTNLHLESVSISGESRVGALAGRTQGAVIQGVTASGSIDVPNTTVSGSNAGGLVGYAVGSEITDSGADVAVSVADHNSGGLVGFALGTEIVTSRSLGDMVGNGSDAINMGGLVGFLNSGSTVEDSYATGSVNGTGIRIGGLVGVMAGTNPVVLTSYAAGTVNAPDNGSSGGLVGDLDAGTVSDSFYTDDQFAEGPDKGASITGAELEDETTFTDAGWSFVATWIMNVAEGRPALQWE